MVSLGSFSLATSLATIALMAALDRPAIVHVIDVDRVATEEINSAVDLHADCEVGHVLTRWFGRFEPIHAFPGHCR